MSAGKIAGWVELSLGAAAVLAGAGVGISAQLDANAIHTTYSPGTPIQTRVNSVNGRFTAAGVMYGVGGALAVTGMVMVAAF
jgi:hypothetical protein